MGSEARTHLSEEQLAQLQDGTLPAGEAGHVESCSYCEGRLKDLQAASAAWVEYRDSIRGPRLPRAPKPWPSLETLIRRQEAPLKTRALRWGPVPALAAAVLLAVVVAAVLHRNAEQPSREVSELLSRSAERVLPGERVISMRVHGRLLLRPAVLTSDLSLGSDPDIARLEVMFTAGHYSWRDPLSPRSFQAWRNGLSEKRDSVSVIRQPGRESAYRVRTEDPRGLLHSASLTLRRRDLHPTDGTFEFQKEGPVAVAEDPGVRPEQASPHEAQMTKQTPEERPASPADTLRVLAALNEIGADVGEPVELWEDAGHRHIVVRAGGLNPQRQQEIAAALKPLPRVVLDLHANGTTPPADSGKGAERYSASIPGPLRQRFEERAGGAIALEQLTDNVLETSASLLARAHALRTLAEKFPPDAEASLSTQDRQLLQALRERHTTELARLVTRMMTEMQPLLATLRVPSVQAGGTKAAWQAGVPALVASVQETDRLLNRVLAGSYSEAEGQAMLRELTLHIERLASMSRQSGR